MTVGFKGRLGLMPFPQRGIEAQVKNNFATAKQKVTLTPLKVIFGNADVRPGDTVFVRPDGAKSWGREELDVDGQIVVVCEEKDVMFVKHEPVPPPPRPAPTPAPFSGESRR